MDRYVHIFSYVVFQKLNDEDKPSVHCRYTWTIFWNLNRLHKQSRTDSSNIKDRRMSPSIYRLLWHVKTSHCTPINCYISSWHCIYSELIHFTCIFTRMMMLSCGNDTLSGDAYMTFKLVIALRVNSYILNVFALRWWYYHVEMIIHHHDVERL